MHSNIVSIALLVVCLLFAACKHKPQQVQPADEFGNFPEAVGNIIVTKCATAGCHNEKSYTNAGGLRLDSWAHLFEGANTGAVVVPYDINYSSLLYFICPDSNLGITAAPRMPLNGAPLTSEEYVAIRDWIASGAPDKNGNIAFSANAVDRQKIYVVHQGCDMVAVIDAESKLVMRYIPVGVETYPESATYIRSAMNGMHAMVSMWYDFGIYKIDARNDKVESFVNLGDLFWNLLHISPDGTKFVTTNGDNSALMLVDIATMQFQNLGNGFVTPHGVTSNRSFDTFYVTNLVGNTIYKFANGYSEQISIDGKPASTISGATPDPYNIAMSPDYSKYFITCEKSGEVRVLSAANDAVIKAIPVGKQPRNMVFSKRQPYMFVSCMEEDNPNAKSKGSVVVINYNTLEVVKEIKGRFFQPHGLAIDEQENTLYIFNRNQDYDGPAPHHQGPCSGRNGFYMVYDIGTLEPVSTKRYEILVDPYVADARFN